MGGGALWLAWRDFVRVLRGVDLEASALESWVRKQGPDGVTRIARAAERDAWRHGVVASVASALDVEGPHRVRACNAALIEASRELGVSGRTCGALWRACLYATASGVVGVVLEGAMLGFEAVLDVLAVGGGATVGVLAISRVAAQWSSEHQAAIDRWVERSLRASRGGGR